jgi:hypothetical protein
VKTSPNKNNKQCNVHEKHKQSFISKTMNILSLIKKHKKYKAHEKHKKSFITENHKQTLPNKNNRQI